jgi:ATP-dependent exoDNAse (exonuclease V) beta subunit
VEKEFQLAHCLYSRTFPHLKPYRTEWTVYHEDLKLAGSIDMVYENPDGTLSIYDWKRSKDITRINNFNKYALTECISHMPDANFWHYSLQLNTYKAILEKNYGKKFIESSIDDAIKVFQDAL